MMDHFIKNLINELRSSLLFRKVSLPLEFVRVTEKFDVVKKAAYKTGFNARFTKL